MKQVLAAGLMLTLVVGSAQAQVPTRVPACVSANDAVTAARLGRDRNGASVRRDLALSVSVGQNAVARCRNDDGFMLAYALARVDLARDTTKGTPQSRTAIFNTALADLEAIKTKVIARQSDRLEIFNVLGLIYYETNQFSKSLATIDASAPLVARMTPESRQKMFVTRGMAQAQLGKSADAARSFDNAARFGHPNATDIKRKMLGTTTRY